MGIGLSDFAIRVIQVSVLHIFFCLDDESQEAHFQSA